MYICSVIQNEMQMRCLGNIVTDSKFDDSPLYNVVKSIDDIIPTIPTLIISWKKTQDLFPNVNILDWEIGNGIYWCFGKRERNYRYQEDIAKFRKLILEQAKKSIDYSFFNILIEDNVSKRVFMNNIKENLTSYYIKNDFVYLYFENLNIVYGVSLRDIEYSGGNKSKFLNMLSKVESAERIYIEYSEIPFEIMSEINSNTYMIPFIFSKEPIYNKDFSYATHKAN